MCREILFKAKRKDNGEWVEGYFVEQDYPEYHAYIVKSINIEMDNRHIDILERDIIEVDPETICQYTGLTDKNGKKIWEHDIVKQFADCNELGNSLYFFYKIRWNNEYCAFEGVEIYSKETFLFPDLEDAWVISNIFDNPELLKER